MEYITTGEASAKWGISTIRITVLAKEGRIPGAQRLGRSWLIPADATKPESHRGRHSAPAEQARDNFSFPLYPFRPDWSPTKAAQLSEQQQNLLAAENAVLECRFEDAWPVLEAILRSPDDICTEIGCLWNAGICCLGLNKPKDFSKCFLRLQMLLAQDFPHRDDLLIILDALKTYVETIGSAANDTVINADVHEQALPLTCILKGYVQMAKEAVKPGSADVSFLKLNLRLLETTSTAIVVEMMHCYLLGIYSLRQDTANMEEHAKAIVQIAFDNKLYFPLVSYYRYNIPVFSQILAQYPEEFRNHCLELSSQFEKNLTSLASSVSESSVVSKLTDADYPYAFSVMMGLSNTRIAKKMGVSLPTVTRRLDKLCKKLGVLDKKELKTYLQSYM